MPATGSRGDIPVRMEHGVQSFRFHCLRPFTQIRQDESVHIFGLEKRAVIVSHVGRRIDGFDARIRKLFHFFDAGVKHTFALIIYSCRIIDKSVTKLGIIRGTRHPQGESGMVTAAKPSCAASSIMIDAFLNSAARFRLSGNSINAS